MVKLYSSNNRNLEDNRKRLSYLLIALDKNGYQVNIFLFLHKNISFGHICCGFSLEVPARHF